MTDFSQAEAALKARLTDLQRRLTGIEAELDQPHAQDWEEAASEREGDEVLEAIGLNGQAQMRAIAAALVRIAQGTYGTCAKCGADIGTARHNALPEAALCLACAQV